jgi:hypothetical protein
VRCRRDAAAGSVPCVHLGHYVSDVLAGYALGAAWVAAVIGPFNVWHRQDGLPPANSDEDLDVEHRN